MLLKFGPFVGIEFVEQIPFRHLLTNHHFVVH